VSGVGQLNLPHYPEIEGLDDFKGKLMHSARWDWSYPLEGKRIGIIGNGATAAQIIPEVSKVASSLTVFQRTPNWVIPRDDGKISPATQAALKYIPGLRSRYRGLLMDVRESLYDTTIVTGSEGNDALRAFAQGFMHKQIPGRPDLWEKLTPKYALGCKRVLISDDFYPALGQDHVKLETSPIQRVTEKGVAVEGKEYEFDLLILATGFRTTEFMYPIKVIGTGGRSIEEIWKGGARAYLGVTIDSLPNFGMLYGPNTNLGHNSIILMIEAQSRYINSLIAPVLQAKSQGKSLAIVPRPSRVKAYNDDLQAKLSGLTFADPNCNSWYKTADGLITNNWAGTVVQYQKALSKVNWASDYEASGSGADVVAGKNQQYIGRVIEETVVPVLAITTYSTVAAALALGWMAASKSPAVQKAIANVF
jgi:cation diffusion facilitator CzcD-associated flavoprotein CzcO